MKLKFELIIYSFLVSFIGFFFFLGHYDSIHAQGTPTITPMHGDYDGDGKDDFVFFITGQEYGNWRILKSSTQFKVQESYFWGVDTDIPVDGDFDGDGIKDLSVFRPSNNILYVLKSSCNRTCMVSYYVPPEL